MPDHSNNNLDRHQEERGAALVIVLLISIPVLIASGSYLNAVIGQGREIERLRRETAADSLAASGAHEAIGRLSASPTLQGNYTVAFDGGMSSVTINDWSSDGIDNDGDGVIDSGPEMNLVGVQSIGWNNAVIDEEGKRVDTSSHAARGETSLILQRTSLDVLIEQALYIDDPMAIFDLNGNAFSISGYDTNPDGSGGGESARFGIGVAGSPDDIIAQVALQQEDNIIGEGGDLSIGEVTPTEMGELLGSLRNRATLTWSDADASYSGDLGDYATNSPIVAHAEGNLTISGNTSGAGILLVDGDLELTGNFDYVGVIVVRGSVVFRGGGSDKNIWGSVLALGAIEDQTDIELSGTIQLQYSSTGVQLAQQIASGGFEVVAWIQE